MYAINDLKKFHLLGKLGEGADSEVFAATDTNTGTPVVLKRPHSALIARAQHHAVERRMSQVIALRERLSNSLPHISSLIAYTAPTSHDAYFGDGLVEEYTVVVEERASGIPLVGSAIDGIKGHPVGAPQNLFAMHPVFPHPARGRFSIVRDLIEVAEAFWSAGSLILDMRPQNIYFEPRSAVITVIDIGGVTEARAAGGRKPPLDLHDFYLELFKWYVPVAGPPFDAESYLQPVGMDTVPMFKQNLDTMIRRLSETPAEPWKSETIDLLGRVKRRDYPSVRAFRSDFDRYMELMDRHYDRLLETGRTAKAWRTALSYLEDDYWRKYRFDPSGLRGYRQLR